MNLDNFTADEFEDMMPHRILVTSKAPINDWGQVDYDPATARTYMCLLDVSERIVRTATGNDITVQATAYVNAIPIGHTEPWAIDSEDKIEFTPPPEGQPSTRPIATVSYHYWRNGALHNMEVVLK